MSILRLHPCFTILLISSTVIYLSYGFIVRKDTSFDQPSTSSNSLNSSNSSNTLNSSNWSNSLKSSNSSNTLNSSKSSNSLNSSNSSITLHSLNTDQLYCHGIQTNESLPDISDNPPNIQRRNIFFLETSCNSYNTGKLFIKARQACAVESAARMNPNMDVHLLFASPGIIKDEGSESDRILRLLKRYPNIKLHHFNINRYVAGSPVEILWTTGKIKKSLYPLAHNSDVLRLLTLWKYGGIYLDLDIIVIKSLESLPENFAGAESESTLANGVMGFCKYGKGREYIKQCIDDISKNFNGGTWASNGPALISRNIFSHCPDFDGSLIVRFGRCENFTILPPSAFYLIPYPRWQMFFNEKLTEIIEPYIEERSYLIHVWNKLSVNQTIPKYNEKVPYLHFAYKYCPGVVQELDEVF